MERPQAYLAGKLRLARLFDTTSSSITSFNDHLARNSNPVVAIAFTTSIGERVFTEEDAIFAHALINLPDRGRLPLAFVSGKLSGADLALALFCPLVAIECGAELSAGFGRPASAAVYIAAARRLGSVTCERLLFGPSSLSAEDAGSAHLGEVVTSAADALALGDKRVVTMIGVAQANLVTWRMPLSKMRALVDGP